MNKIILVGNTTKAVESREKMAKVSIAVSRDYKNANGSYDVDYFDLVAFGHQAEFMSKYVHKGDKLVVSGRMQIRQYEAQDGTKRKIYEVLVESVENITPKAKEEPMEEIKDDIYADPDFTDDVNYDEDIPF